MEKRKPIVIGVTGGSGSGKTSVSRKILENFPELTIVKIDLDYYYKDQSHMPFEERLKTNYDHPFAFDTDLLIEHMNKLINFESIEEPVYDYENHTRSDKKIHQEPKDVILIEGILILEDKRLRDLMDIKVYVDTDDDIRIIRRIKRDMVERGRTLDSIIHQYMSVVKPMHHQFIEPTKKFADIIIPEGGSNTVAIDLMTTKIASILRELKLIFSGKYIAETLAGSLEIVVDNDFIWMDMASPKVEYIFNLDEIKEIYSAFNLDTVQAPKNLIPKIVNTGLSDIIIPIEDKNILDSFVMNKEKVIELSKKYKVVGAHLFTLDNDKKVTAFCRNIAPLVGIDEECATGTSNGALTHYLKDYNIISNKDINTFIQGETMGRASTILSRYKEDGRTIQVGGNAVISFECKIYE